MRRIGILEEQALLRTGLQAFFDKDITECCLTAENHQDLIDKIRIQDPDLLPELLIIGVGADFTIVFQTLQWLKDNYPKIKVIVLTQSEIRPKDAIKIVGMGVSSFLNKEVSVSEFIETVNQVLKNGPYFTGKNASLLLDHINNPNQEKQSSAMLSEREMKILRLICSEQTSSEIANSLSLSIRTVENYKMNLIKKLNVKSTVGLAIAAFKNKLIEY